MEEEVIYKKCNKCLKIKVISDFYKKHDSKDGFMSCCKECRSEYDDTRYNNNKEYLAAYAKNRRKNKPGLHRKAHLKKLYNLTLEGYNSLFNLQEGRCEICGKHQSELNRPMSVDHNHITGNIRGLLCVNCNSAIGLLKDNKILLYSAIEYLNKNNN